MSQKNRIVKNETYGIGSVPRILDTINSFKRKYGSWPTRVLMDKGMADAIREYHLTQEAWDSLAKKVDISYTVEGNVIAENERGDSYEYDSSFIPPESRDSSADFWIWGIEI